MKNLLDEYKKEKMPDAETPFHYEAEAWSTMKRFLAWVKERESK